MPWVGFESTIPAFKRAKTIHALDHAPLWAAWRQLSLYNCNNDSGKYVCSIWNTSFRFYWTRGQVWCTVHIILMSQEQESTGFLGLSLWSPTKMNREVHLFTNGGIALGCHDVQLPASTPVERTAVSRWMLNCSNCVLSHFLTTMHISALYHGT
jgi:hypothetical protein